VRDTSPEVEQKFRDLPFHRFEEDERPSEVEPSTGPWSVPAPPINVIRLDMWCLTPYIVLRCFWQP